MRSPIESLEARLNFGATVHTYLISGELIVNGSSRADTLKVFVPTNNPDAVEVDITTAGYALRREFYTYSDITKITVNGGVGNDVIEIYKIKAHPTVAQRLVTLDGGENDDTITIFATDTANVITGGYGRDTINILGGASSVRLKDGGDIDHLTAPAAGTYVKNKDSKDKITLI